MKSRLILSLAVALVASSAEVRGQSLDGVWEVTAVIDNGRVVPPNEIVSNYAADGHVVINGQTAELLVPMTYQRKKLPFAVDPSKSPARLDLAGAEKTGGRGIIMVSGDNLMLCLASRDRDRPTAFTSLPGSGSLLITLKRAANNTAPTPPGAPPKYTDDQLRPMLVGTWGHQDADTIHYITLNSDGSMRAMMTWKDNFKKMFHQDVRSDGTWKLQDGVVLVKIDSSTDKERRGQIYSFRPRSINETELIAVDANGEVRQEWRSQ